MRNIKVAIALIFVAGVMAALAGPSLAYPPFLSKARKFGAKDCTFCHAGAEGGLPFNARGQWLIKEKERRNADVVDPAWLADYKPDDSPGGKSSQPPGSEEKKAAQQPAATRPANPTESALLSIYNELIEASKKQDLAVITRILADDFTETSADGVLFGKAQVLAAIPQFTIESYLYDDVATRVYGDTAIMTLRQTSKGTFRGVEVGGNFRQTLVWVKREGRWQIAAAHASRITKQ